MAQSNADVLHIHVRDGLAVHNCGVRNRDQMIFCSGRFLVDGTGLSVAAAQEFNFALNGLRLYVVHFGVDCQVCVTLQFNFRHHVYNCRKVIYLVKGRNVTRRRTGEATGRMSFSRSTSNRWPFTSFSPTSLATVAPYNFLIILSALPGAEALNFCLLLEAAVHFFECSIDRFCGDFDFYTVLHGVDLFNRCVHWFFGS